MRVAILSLILALASCTQDVDDTSAVPGAGRQRLLAVVNSDYVSTSVSVVDPITARVVADNVVHSGSRAPGLSLALSGDVVLPSTNDPGGRLVLIDRYPNGVLTFFDAAQGRVVGQLAVAQTFASNPQDIAFLGDGRAYVSRHETSPGGTDGDDLLVFDVATLRVTGRIPLTSFAGTTDRGPAQARPTRVARAAGHVWVALAALNLSFDRGAEGVVVGVDPGRDAVAHRVAIPGAANCGDLAVTAGEDALWVVCSGVYQEGPAAQLARSGLARIDLTRVPPAVDRWLPAGDLLDRPLGGDVAIDRGGRPYAVALGDLTTGVPDRVFRVEPATGATTLVFEGRDAFGLGGLLIEGGAGRIWIAQGNLFAPALLAFTTDEATPREVARFAPNPSVGLPPRVLGWLPAKTAAPVASDAGTAGGGRDVE